MQLSLSTLILIVTLMASIVISENKKEIQVEKTRIGASIGKMDENESEDQILPPNELYLNEQDVNSPRRHQLEKSRGSRSNEISINPTTSSFQDLAEKLAEAELKSPRMRETFKKLTDIHAPRLKYSGRTNPSEISLLRSKGPRKRKKKRHKGRRSRNHGQNKWHDSRQRFARQILNVTRKIDYKNAKNRREKSIRYPPVETFEKFSSDQQFLDNPYANLNPGINYPGIEDFDTSLQNSILDENIPANYVSNYSPIGDQIDNPAMSNSMLDNSPDFDMSNDRITVNQFDTPDNSFDDQLRSSDNDGDSNFQNNQQSFAGSRENRFLDRVNENPRQKNRMLRGPNRLLRKSNHFRGNRLNTKSKNVRKRVSHKNSKNRLVSKNLKTVDGEKNRISKSHSTEVSSKSSTDSSKNLTSENTTNESSTKSTLADFSKTTKEMSSMMTTNGKNVKARNASKEEKLNTENSENGALSPETNGKNLNNNSAIINETREVAGHILNKIIEELEDLKLERNKNDRLEGLPCKLSGSWVTTQAGVRIDLLVKNGCVNVSMANLNLPVGIVRKGLLNHTWNMTGYAPFRRGGPFSLVATDNHTKTLAVFVGACRVCQGIDTIEGVWSIGREPRDCRDFQMSTSIHNDIFRKTHLPTDLKDKQLAMSNSAKSTSSSSSTKEDYADSENTELS